MFTPICAIAEVGIKAVALAATSAAAQSMRFISISHSYLVLQTISVFISKTINDAINYI
jgi:hypothetical protein